MTDKLYSEVEYDEAVSFAERALIDFDLLDAFLHRPAAEQAAFRQWIASAGNSEEEEMRVSEMLDSLYFGRPSPVTSGELETAGAQGSV